MLNFCFCLKKKRLQSGKARISYFNPGERKHKMGENTLGRLLDLVNVFKSLGPFYILVMDTKMQQNES